MTERILPPWANPIPRKATELIPLTWGHNAKGHRATDGDSGYYSITKTEGVSGKDAYLLQFTPREEYDKLFPERRSCFRHQSLEWAKHFAEQDRLYRIQAAEKAERAAKCTIAIPTLTWTTRDDGSLVSDPPGYVVLHGSGHGIAAPPSWANAPSDRSAGFSVTDQDGRTLCSSNGTIKDALKFVEERVWERAIIAHIEGVADIVDEFASQDPDDTRIMRTLAAYRLMKVVAADVNIHTGGIYVKVGSGDRDVIHIPQHCWLRVGYYDFDCAGPAFRAGWPNANWAFHPKGLAWMDCRMRGFDDELDDPPELGDTWGDIESGHAEWFTQKIRKVQLQEGRRILRDTERLRKRAAERQGVPYVWDSTVYPLVFAHERA